MQPVSLACAARPPRPRGRAIVLSAALAAMSPSLASAAEGTCPWIVQPAADAKLRAPEQAYEIMFDGLDLNVATFYGFSVTSMDLAWQLAKERSLPELNADARRLESVETTLGTFFQLAPDTIEPHIIYLVASDVRVEELEKIGARIEPSRQLAISHLAMRTRGGSDQSGPLPHRSVPGVLIADASSASAPEVQICAYQVAMR
jgi:hypothetical protein